MIKRTIPQNILNIIIFSFWCVMSIPCKSATINPTRNNSQHTGYHHNPSFFMGLNDDGYILEGGYAYIFNNYLIAGCNLGFAMGFGTSDSQYNGPDNQISSINVHSNDVRLKIIPNIKFQTPSLYKIEDNNMDFYLFGTPGLIISPGSSRSKHANLLNLSFRTGIECRHLRWLFNIAYDVTDFSLYSGTSVKHKKVNQGVIVGIGALL